MIICCLLSRHHSQKYCPRRVWDTTKRTYLDYDLLKNIQAVIHSVSHVLHRVRGHYKTCDATGIALGERAMYVIELYIMERRNQTDAKEGP